MDNCVSKKATIPICGDSPSTAASPHHHFITSGAPSNASAGISVIKAKVDPELRVRVYVRPRFITQGSNSPEQPSMFWIDVENDKVRLSF